MRARSLALSGLWFAVLILCWPPISAAVDLGLHDDRCVQIVAAPLLFAFLMYWERNRILPKAAWSPIVGMPLLSLALLMYFVFLRRTSYGSEGGRLAPAVLSVILAWMAGFVFCYGLRSLRAAFFPLCCLLLMIPVPASAMDKLTAGLQHGSAMLSYQMLPLAGIPVFAQGMRMSLAGLEIEVAPECSGIRSFLALALIGLLAARVCLRSNWSRFALVVSTIPIAILKNALRISVIASLSAYVDRAFLYGPIHRYGGLVFTPLGVALLVAFLAALQRFEVRIATRRRGLASRIPEVTVAKTI
jgi:exosortase